MIIDIFTYNGEKEMLDLRLNILKPYVDRFIAVQSPTTFTGKEKPIYKTPEGVDDFINLEEYTEEELKLAEESPNTKGADHWKHEFLQKERIKLALEDLDDDDLVFIGDVDEIWIPGIEVLEGVHKLNLRVYTYYLNNRSNEMFWGTIVGRYKDIKDECLNHLRVNAKKTVKYGGWHFTSMGGVDRVREKLQDQYTPDSYYTPEVAQSLETAIKEVKDFLGRDFKYEIDESEWPQYLKKNKEKYKHLMYNE
jgi:beta-1,4-mannosyl-glycoprotein beta-1,4-N-acetylglucosaminyltransferase